MEQTFEESLIPSYVWDFAKKHAGGLVAAGILAFIIWQFLKKRKKEMYDRIDCLFKELKVGDKVHTPSGYSKIIKIINDKVVVRSQDPAGEFEYDISQVHKEDQHKLYDQKIITGAIK